MPIKSFRGMLADGATETISLHTNNGSVGYKIKKLQIIPNTPGSNIDGVVKVFTIEPGAAAATVDFRDQPLIAVAWNYNDTYETQQVVVFDNVTFNQDIYVQLHEDKSSGAMNYHIELEQVKLDLNENTVATLKDIRNIVGQ